MFIKSMDFFGLSFSTRTTFKAFAPEGKTYLPFQHAGVEYAVNRIIRGDNVLIADPPGLGKTIQAIGVINYLLEHGERVLIIAPASVLLNWKKEIEAWATDDHIICVLKNSKQEITPNASIVICSYNLAAALECFKKLVKLEYRILILDELHYIKNPKATRTRAIFGGTKNISKRCKSIIGLTGTPIPNRVKEMYAPIRGLNFKTIDRLPFMDYAVKYCGAYVDHFGHWYMDGASNADELATKLRTHLMIRRDKDTVLDMLPEKFERLVFLAQNTETKNLLKMERPIKMEYLKSGDGALSYEGLATVRRELGMQKVPGAVEHIKEKLLEYDKAVVFCHHKDVFDALHAALSPLGLCSVRGKDDAAARFAAVERFQNDKTARVFLGSITAAGIGVTLTAANYVAIVEPSWVPGENSQAVDRLHRYGQNRGVLAEYLVFEGSLDCEIMRTNLSKLKNIKEVLIN